MKTIMMLLLLFSGTVLYAQTLSSFINEIEKHKAQLFDYSLADWNKTFRSKKNCLVSDNGKKFHSSVYYDNNGNLVKFKIEPGRTDRRMQICFLKSKGLYFGKAFSTTGDNTTEPARSGNFLPPPPPVYGSRVSSFFENSYIYDPAGNDLYVINYTNNYLRRDTTDADFVIGTDRYFIIAVYHFKADLLCEHKYIEPAGAMGMFGFSAKRIDFKETEMMFPIIYYGAPPEDYAALKNTFYRDSAFVTNAYFIDAKRKTAYETNVVMDSLLQFNVAGFTNKNMLRSPVAGNAIKFPGSTIRFNLSFDILDVGRETVGSRSRSSVW